MQNESEKDKAVQPFSGDFYCKVGMSVILPTRNVGKFKDLFLSWDRKKNESKKRYFAKSFLNHFGIDESNGKGMSLVTVDFDCAQSMRTCMSDRAGYVDEKTCPSLDTVVKELGIRRLLGRGDELFGLEELATFDSHFDSKVQYAERGVWPYPCDLEFEPDDDARQDDGKESRGSDEEPER